MSGQIFLINVADNELAVRIGEIVVPNVRVTIGTFGTVRVAGGVPGPQGLPGESSSEAMSLHILDPTPHPVYDDLPSFTLLFENGLI